MPAIEGSKAAVRIFVEETGKTGFAFLMDLPDPRKLAQVNPGDCGRARARGQPPHRDRATGCGSASSSRASRPGCSSSSPTATSTRPASPRSGAVDVRIIIREIYQDPRNYGKVSFPTAAKSTDLRPYTKGTLVREDEELEEDLEDDVEDEEIEDLDRVLPPEDTTDEAFVEETDELDES